MHNLRFLLRRLPRCLLGAILLSLCGAAAAAAYPARPVRLIVPLAPGGGMDIIARGVAQKLTDALGQSIVVDNRSGAGGSIGAELTARAAPDGYTILMASASSVTHQLLYRPRYDMGKDYAAISQVSAQPYVLIVHPSIPAATAEAFIAYARANPGRLNYASSGNGGLIHLTGELFQTLTGTRMVHVPYKGLAMAYPDILGGQVQLTFASIISALPYAKSGRLRAVAVTSRARAKALPETPSLHEAGVPGFDVTQWYGLFAPAQTPRAIVERLHQETAALLRLPDVTARMAADGSEAVGSTPQAFAAHVRSELAKWGGVIRQAGIRVE